jgi:uncharacterized membrane protein YphA (DoxX/SURF4 family)
MNSRQAVDIATMNNQPASGSSSLPRRGRGVAGLVGRWVLGGVFIYMGLTKALHPVDFLKVLRQYELVENHVLLNLIAAGLPWFEVLCGLLLLAGIAVRGSTLLLLGMLIPFTLVVLKRALAIHAAKAIPFCAISFDCGCGGGAVVICHKLLENSLLILLSLLLLAVRAKRLSLRYDLIKSRQSGGK